MTHVQQRLLGTETLQPRLPIADPTQESLRRSDDDREDDIPLAQLISRAVAALNINPALAMTSDNLLAVDSSIELFPDL